MKILSIIWTACSSAAVMIDGKIVACVSQERFSRKKNDESYPLQAIEAVLAQAGIKPQELDLVAIAGELFDPAAVLCHKYTTFSVQDKVREQLEYWYPKLYNKKDVFYLDVFKDKIDTGQYPGNWNAAIDFLKNGDQDAFTEFFQDFRRQAVSKHLGVDPKKIIFTNHHRSHAYYSYYASPIKKENVLILTADAWGDGINASVSVGNGSDIRLLSTSANCIIARLYRFITLLLGMKPDEHEYKVMGLAGYARPEYYQAPLALLKEIMQVDGLGFSFKKAPPDMYFYFKDKFSGVRFDSIAGALQQYTQDILVEWTRNALKATGAKRICFAGGVAMNIKAMKEIAELAEVEDVFICPSPSDESLAMGAAYVAMHDICLARGQNPLEYLSPLKDAYLGPEADKETVQAVVEDAAAKGFVVRKSENKHIAKMVASGKIIGRCKGKSEFGARALGNRSIIADPRRHEVIKAINEKIKSRDFWMPFAPSILAENSGDYLVNPKGLKSPYMTVAFDTKPAAQDGLRAALHQYDLTVRPQVVNKEVNPEYHDLILQFLKLTGVGAVLNTSFNVHGEPIVQTPEDAFDVFQRTGLDALLLDGYLIERTKENEERS